MLKISNLLFSNKNRIGLLLGPVFFVIVLSLTPPLGMSIEAQAILASTLWIATWWISEAIPIPITSLLPLIVFPLSGALSLNMTAAAYGHPIVFLFLGGFTVALAMEKWNLHKRIALTMILMVGTNKTKIVLGFMLSTAFLSMWISNTATAMMMLPIGMAVVHQFAQLNTDGDDQQRKLGKAIMLGIAYAASIGGMATLVGTPANAILVGVAEKSLGTTLSFYEWMKFAFPLTCLLLISTWAYLVKVVFPLKDKSSNQAVHSAIEAQLKALGKITAEEKWVSAVFIFTAFCWISRTFLLNKILPVLDDSMIAIFSAVLLFIIPASSKNNKEALLTWDIARKLPWGILLLFGGGLAIAAGFETTGLASWIGEQMTLLNNVSAFVIILGIVTAINFLTEITSNTATATMMLPIMASLAIAVGIHPYALMVAACLASSCAFMLPVATPPNAIVFSSGFLKMNDMVKAGFGLNLIAIAIIALYIYWLLGPIWGIEIVGITF